MKAKQVASIQNTLNLARQWLLQQSITSTSPKLELILLAFFLFALNISTSAQTYTFSNNFGQFWSTSSNWAGGLPPNPLPSGQTIIINGYCNLDMDQTIEGALEVQSGSLFSTDYYSITNIGTLTVSPNTRIQAVFILNNGILYNNGTILTDNVDLINSGTITNYDTIVVDGSDAYYNNTGTITNEADAYLEVTSVINISEGVLNNNGWLKNAGLIRLNDIFIAVLNNNAGATFENPGYLEVYDGDSLNNWGTIISDSIRIDLGYLNNYSGGVLTSTGDLFVSGSPFTQEGTLNNSGIFKFNGGTILDNSGTITNTGYTEFYTTQLINESGGAFINSGQLSIYGDVTNAAGGTFTNSNIFTFYEGTFTNNGTITNNSGAEVNLEETFFKTLTNNSVIVNNGVINAINYSFEQNGIYSGSGVFNGSLTLTNPSGSILRPGSSPGCMTLNQFTNQGSVEIEIEGTTACTQYDRVNVTGAATLGGTMDVTWEFTPSAGDEFIVMTYGSKTGTMTVNIPPISGLIFTESYSSTQMKITVISLPVELLEFEASWKGEGVKLDWETASETNNEGFLIERSFDGKNWRELGFVQGHGTSLELQSYSFVDRQPGTGMNYYRLKQLDFDGAFEYSKVIAFEMESNENELNFFPNPATNVLHLSLPSSLTGDGTATWYDMLGNKLSTDYFLCYDSSLTIPIDRSFIQLPGIYMLKVMVDKKQWVKKVCVK